MYAIIKTGGKQYKVTKGDIIDVELLGLDQGATVKFDDVLFLCNGDSHFVGIPTVPGSTVLGEIIGDSVGPKIQSVKYKPRKRQNKKFGHRQHYSRVKINEIVMA
mgnify:CR=1 FL=1